MQQVLAAVRLVAADFATDSLARGQRENLDPEDFHRLAQAGFLRTGIPLAEGGLWEGLQRSARAYAELVGTIAQADPSVALVASMHPLVATYWMAVPASANDSVEARTQRNFVFASMRTGHWWGTVTSEPGSGGDILRTKAQAVVRASGDYLLSGEKHFGSGAGVMSFMTTTARVADSKDPAVFFLDMRQRPWDGSSGVTLVRSWDGHGMSATQSHAFRFLDMPANRLVAGAEIASSRGVMLALMGCVWTGVAIAILRNAQRWGRAKLKPQELRAYEKSEWVQIENKIWLCEQAHEGVLRCIETTNDLVLAQQVALQAKLTIAELAEDLLARMARVLGGATFSRSQPIGQWSHDIRALGFLRPPWGLAIDQLFELLTQDL